MVSETFCRVQVYPPMNASCADHRHTEEQSEQELGNDDPTDRWPPAYPPALFRSFCERFRLVYLESRFGLIAEKFKPHLFSKVSSTDKKDHEIQRCKRLLTGMKKKIEGGEKRKKEKRRSD